MSTYDDATQRLPIARPADTEPAPTPLPGPLDLTGGPADGTGWPEPHETDVEPPAAETTQTLFLDEIFDAPRDPATAAADAPTWTAMPVVPVRSEPVPSYDAPTPAGAPAPATAAAPRAATAERLRADAQAAWSGAVRRTTTWLSSGDNAVILLTACVAILLIAVVAALS